jgi:hypothetical protein
MEVLVFGKDDEKDIVVTAEGDPEAWIKNLQYEPRNYSLYASPAEIVAPKETIDEDLYEQVRGVKEVA